MYSHYLHLENQSTFLKFLSLCSKTCDMQVCHMYQKYCAWQCGSYRFQRWILVMIQYFLMFNVDNADEATQIIRTSPNKFQMIYKTALCRGYSIELLLLASCKIYCLLYQAPISPGAEFVLKTFESIASCMQVCPKLTSRSYDGQFYQMFSSFHFKMV